MATITHRLPSAPHRRRETKERGKSRSLAERVAHPAAQPVDPAAAASPYVRSALLFGLSWFAVPALLLVVSRLLE